MVFAHDTERALAGAVALVNTRTSGGLETRSDLAEFARSWDWTESLTGTAAELAAVRELRGRLRTLWLADESDVVTVVNALLREGHAMPQLVRHDAWPYHLHATDPDQPLADRMAVEAAMAVVDVVRVGELDRLRTCAGSDCADVLVDLSRNRSRRFCAAGCGNRANVAAYRRRRAGH